MLSVIIIAWLTAITVVLLKVRHVLKNIEAITSNIASASDWISPVKLFSQAAKLFRK
jgi:hypothetical protein